MFSYHLSPLVGRISFRCFRMSSFVCIALPLVDIFLIFLFFRQYFLVYFLKVYCYFSLYCLFLFVFTCSSVFPSLYNFGLFSLIFFICVSSRISYPGFDFFPSCFLRGSQFFQKLIFLMHKLVHLIRLYYLLIYNLVLDLFLPFPSWMFSILCFLVMVR